MPQKVILGGRTVLLNKSWLLPENESIFVEFEDEDGDSVKIRIEVLTSENNEKNEKPKAALEIDNEEDVAVITFINWNQPFGNSTAKPIAFAVADDGRIELSFLANIAKISSLYRVEFQVMSVVKNELT
ncbi:hypothetical protein T35B1_11837 [Salinisphaera shabanensis T35B1]|uniref:DUF6864 domain-containing function n=1 Tax=Salinisphaera shabanensis TaxID=180542 RepID=UPI0033413D10